MRVIIERNRNFMDRYLQDYEMVKGIIGEKDEDGGDWEQG